MLRRRVDTSVTFSRTDYPALEPSRMVEDPNQDPVPPSNPPQRSVDKEPYLAGPRLAEAVDLALALGRPLLLQGDPGCGKTRLAYAVGYALGWPVEECYIKSTTRAQDLLYTYDAVRRLYDAQLGAAGPRDERTNEPLCGDARNYVRLGPLGRAIARASYGRRSVVLLDEIDKADLDFPNDLLLELDRWRFGVPEAPALAYDGSDPAARPLVVVTHNEEKALPTAFLRRCVYHYVEFPSSPGELEEILRLHREPAADDLGPRAIDVVNRLRRLDLNKKPGLSELIDWVGYLSAVSPPPDPAALPYPGVLLKDRSDTQRAAAEIRGPEPAGGG
jgi:MoxR-like ATPase